MKLFTFFSMLFIFTLSSAIFAQNTAKTIKLNTEFSLLAEQKGNLKADKINIEFVKVLEDSRCPEDVDCVWAGSAKIQIKVSKGKSAAQVFELNTNQEPNFITFQGYKIEVTGLKPGIKSDSDRKLIKYSASFIVRKN